MADLQEGDRIRLPGDDEYVTVDLLRPRPDGGADLYVLRDGQPERVSLTADELDSLELLAVDGAAAPEHTLAALWTQWMHQAATTTSGTALGSAPLRQYPHQFEAVYGAMLPQPMLRFLLADEPGTGKTIMGGLYMTEAARLGFVNRALVVCPAHLVVKWQEDIERFLGRTLRRITADTVREQVLELSDHPFWVVSLQLAAANPRVREAIDPDRAGWDLVIIDEAHAMTPTAQTYFQVGLTVAAKSPRALLMTATPHRGKEWLFRCLMHLVDPAVFPLPTEPKDDSALARLRPGPLHFMRRMKEELVDVDGRTKLFKKRTAHNIPVSLSLPEKTIYDDALQIVADFFPPSAVGLGGMVYGKRAASSLYALGETLRRRLANMGTVVGPGERPAEMDEDEWELIEISHLESRSAREERKQIEELLTRIDTELSRPDAKVSKWPKLVDQVMKPNGIVPGGDEQLVIFTEYADTAEWLTDRLNAAGYSAETYSGRRTHGQREEIRARFVAGDFQIIVSTDAGNEGIDLQSARVLVNWDIPWSLVTLEQRMGRIHRVGQERDVDLYNLIATDTREGDAHVTLLNNLVNAANELGGKMFDSLALVGEIALADAGIDDLEALLRRCYEPGSDPSESTRAIRAITEERLRQIHREQRQIDMHLAASVQVGKALAGLSAQRLERINPHIVERYLKRLADAGLIRLARSTVADEGLWQLEPKELPKLPFAATKRALVATSGEAKVAAVKAGAVSAEHAVALGPNEEAFRELVGVADSRLLPDLYRGGALVDPTSLTDYRLFVFHVPVREGRLGASGRWRRESAWGYLVKVDDVGPRVVPWETLANLEPADEATPRGMHPAEETNAGAQVRHRVAKDAEARRHALATWLRDARVQLEKLPNDLTDDIDDPEEQRKARKTVDHAVRERINDLKAAVELDVGEPELAGWAHVSGTAASEDIDDVDSETVAMRHVTDLLNADGWAVADVHTEKLGYDLKATRGPHIRLVEVKGLRGSAASKGISLTGAELATAGIHGGDYWLYVVDSCEDGKGTLFAAWRNPAKVFADVVRDVALLRIRGSELKAAKEETQ